jgi:hypothetical protein
MKKMSNMRANKSVGGNGGEDNDDDHETEILNET